jgi:hypothetical protein
LFLIVLSISLLSGILLRACALSFGRPFAVQNIGGHNIGGKLRSITLAARVGS